MFIKVRDQADNTLSMFTVKTIYYSVTYGIARVFTEDDDEIILKLSREDYETMLYRMYNDGKVDMSERRAWVNDEPPELAEKDGKSAVSEDGAGRTNVFSSLGLVLVGVFIASGFGLGLVYLIRSLIGDLG